MRHLALSLLVAATLAGCGGSDSDDDRGTGRTGPSSAEARPASDEFVQRLDGSCKAAQPKLAAIMTDLIKARDAARAGRVSAPETFRAFAKLLGRAITITERFEVRLRAIEVPSDERTFHNALVGTVERGLANLRLQVRAAEAQDAVRLSELSRNGSVINARQKGLLTGHGGFRVCGRG
jgi:hypothetical protein